MGKSTRRRAGSVSFVIRNSFSRVVKEEEKSRKSKHQKLLIQRDNDDFRNVAFGMFVL